MNTTKLWNSSVQQKIITSGGGALILFCMHRFCREVCWIIPQLYLFFESRDQLMHISSTRLAKISQQRQSELRWLWTSLPWWVACELVYLTDSHNMPGHHSQPILTSLGKSVCSFSCNLSLPPLAGWPWSFMCHRGSMRVEWTLSKSKDRKLTLRRIIRPQLLLVTSLVLYQVRYYNQ